MKAGKIWETLRLCVLVPDPFVCIHNLAHTCTYMYMYVYTCARGQDSVTMCKCRAHRALCVQCMSCVHVHVLCKFKLFGTIAVGKCIIPIYIHVHVCIMCMLQVSVCVNVHVYNYTCTCACTYA